MGEAKRRKVLDPSWGPQTPEIAMTIDISPLTGMYRVIASIQSDEIEDGGFSFVLDSHSLYQDAQEQSERVKPMMQKFSTRDWCWSYRSTLSKVFRELSKVQKPYSKEEMIRGTIGLGLLKDDGTIEIVPADKKHVEEIYKDWGRNPK